MEEIEKLKKFLEEKRKELWEMMREGDLTAEGRGMFIFVNSIYEHMDWNND